MAEESAGSTNPEVGGRNPRDGRQVGETGHLRPPDPGATRGFGAAHGALGRTSPHNWQDFWQDRVEAVWAIWPGAPIALYGESAKARPTVPHSYSPDRFMNALDYLSDRMRQAVRRGNYRVQPGDKWTAEMRQRRTELEPNHRDGQLVVIVIWKCPWGGYARTTMPPTDCPWLVPEDVVPLLSDDCAAVREAAMRLLGYLD